MPSAAWPTGQTRGFLGHPLLRRRRTPSPPRWICHPQGSRRRPGARTRGRPARTSRPPRPDAARTGRRVPGPTHRRGQHDRHAEGAAQVRDRHVRRDEGRPSASGGTLGVAQAPAEGLGVARRQVPAAGAPLRGGLRLRRREHRGQGQEPGAEAHGGADVRVVGGTGGRRRGARLTASDHRRRHRTTPRSVARTRTA